MTTTKYKVKKDRVIYHAGVEYLSGAEVELPPKAALYHADNIEIVSPAQTDLKGLPKDKDVELKKPEPKP
jgi:hypothetical protein